jgi:hypothetical protein
VSDHPIGPRKYGDADGKTHAKEKRKIKKKKRKRVGSNAAYAGTAEQVTQDVEASTGRRSLDESPVNRIAAFAYGRPDDIERRAGLDETIRVNGTPPHGDRRDIGGEQRGRGDIGGGNVARMRPDKLNDAAQQFDRHDTEPCPMRHCFGCADRPIRLGCCSRRHPFLPLFRPLWQKARARVESKKKQIKEEVSKFMDPRQWHCGATKPTARRSFFHFLHKIARRSPQDRNHFKKKKVVC